MFLSFRSVCLQIYFLVELFSIEFRVTHRVKERYFSPNYKIPRSKSKAMFEMFDCTYKSVTITVNMRGIVLLEGILGCFQKVVGECPITAFIRRMSIACACYTLDHNCYTFTCRIITGITSANIKLLNNQCYYFTRLQCGFVVDLIRALKL